jgi:hypothetical protein
MSSFVVTSVGLGLCVLAYDKLNHYLKKLKEQMHFLISMKLNIVVMLSLDKNIMEYKK